MRENDSNRWNARQDLSQFDNPDPYVVLGVDPDASIDEIKNARNKLQLKFHPDKSELPKNIATEISQKINNAYDALAKFDKTQSAAQNRTAKDERGGEQNGKVKAQKEQRMEEVEKEFLSSLENGPGTFARWAAHAKTAGISQEKISELLRSKKAQMIIKNALTQKIMQSIYKTPDYFSLYLEEWRRATGLELELKSFLNSPEIKDFLLKRAADKILYSSTQSPDAFLEFVESWKRAGIDLAGVVRQPKVVEKLTERAISKILYYSTTQSPDAFLEFVESWKRAGVNLKDLINSAEANENLKTRALAKLSAGVGSKKIFSEFVRNWTRAGWKPDKEILDKL